MKLLSIVTPCYNEEDNVTNLYLTVKEVFESLDHYYYEHIFIDNASKDNTVGILKNIAENDKNVKVIINTRNFGHICSPYYALLQTSGEAVILIAADLQDPPSLIPEFISKWEAGYRVALGVKVASEETWLMFTIRQMYYEFIYRVSDIELTKNNTGFGLYDKKVIEILRSLDEPYPYLRGLISEIGFESAKIEYKQPSRKRGITKNNFYTLYDLAMLGITSHAKIPLRLATMMGFALSVLSFCVAVMYFIAKLIFWNSFQTGIAPILVGMFMAFSIQLFFVGMMGEYILAIHTHVLRRPLVVERERINFD